MVCGYPSRIPRYSCGLRALRGSSCCNSSSLKRSPAVPAAEVASECSSHPACVQLALTGSCCPTAEGTLLGCCAAAAEATPAASLNNAASAPSPEVEQLELKASSVPSWCENVPAASQKYVADCGGTGSGSTGSGSGASTGAASWCENVPKSQWHHVADCAGGVSAGSSLKDGRSRAAMVLTFASALAGLLNSA